MLHAKLEVRVSFPNGTNNLLGRIGEKKTLLNNILGRKANWIGHILRRNFFFYDAIDGQMTEVKGVEKEERSSLII